MSGFRFPGSGCATALFCALAFTLPISHAAEHKFSILLDTDNVAATGCAVTTSAGSVAGVERIISAVVATTTTGATVARLEEERCTGSTFAAPTVYDSGGWNVGLNNGLNGKAVVEFSVPLATLPVGGTMKALVTSRNSAGQQDSTSAFLIGLLAAVTPPADAVPVPLASGLALLLAVLIAVALSRVLKSGGAARMPVIVVIALLCSALAWAATVNRDGNIGDWLGVSPAVTDPVGDAPPNADIVAVFYQQDTSNLFFRIDADIQLDAPVNQAPVVNVGPNQTITLPATATLAGNATDDGLPNPPAALTYTWSVVSGPVTGVTFANAGAAATTATFPVAGVYVLRLTASDSVLTGSATVQITVGTAAPVNQAPVVNAGANQTITLPATASLSGSATDDGLPNPPAALTYVWSVVSGPSTAVTFANATARATTATFPAAGVYVLRLTASDSLLSGSATVQITVGTVAPVNQAPVVNAGANQTITLPAAASLSGSATDDGLPNPPGALAYTWSVVSGPSTAVTFASATARATTATFPAAGVYMLRLTASDSLLTGSATVQITVGTVAPVNQAPVVNAGANQTITLPASAPLSGSATDDGLPNPPGALTYTWSVVSGPSTSVTFANANAATTIASFPTAGVYVLRLTASDSLLLGSSTVQVTVQAAAIVNQAPVVNAGTNQTLSMPGSATLSGSATDDGLPNPPAALTYQWTMVSGPSSGVTFANVAAASTTVTLPAVGTYVLRLVASDSVLSGSSTVQIVVSDGGPKFVAIADRTIPVGVRFQQVLTANDANPFDTLVFSLTSGPIGASLNPAPKVDWTPSNAQLGTHLFAASVVDINGHSDSTTFRVTVVAQNRAPSLAAQPAVTVARGATFSRALAATDPDGDLLTFALVSGPSGMTLSGSTLSWPTASIAPGEYSVTVKASDPGGLFDAARFVVKVVASAAPIAVDDAYAVRLGQTLTVPASGLVGVLGNDNSPSGNALSAVKLSNPDKGTLSAFNANGGFTYQAPPTLPGAPFIPVLRNHKDLPVPGFTGQAPIMIDLDGDGKPELVIRHPNHTIAAYHADTGNVLWRFDGSFFTGCTPYAGIAEFHIVAGDIDDDGKPEVLFTASCAGDKGSQRVVALNGQNGTVKWISAPLEAVPVIGDEFSLAERPAPTIARLRPGESPSVLLAAEKIGAHRTAVVGFDTFVEPACRAIVETVPDGTYQPLPSLVPIAPPHYFHCTGVIVLNGTDGTIRQRMIAERFSAPSIFRDGSREGHGDLHTIVVDLDGDGVPEIVTNGAVFNVNGSVRWTGAPSPVYDIAVGNFDDTPDVEVVRREREANGTIASLAVYKQNGTLLWRLPVDDTTFGSKITVADLDGDGKADIVFSEGVLLCAVNHLGVYRWCYDASVAGVSWVDSRTRYAIFDFDGDGVPEVVVQTTQAILFLDGATGKVKATFPISKATTGSTREPPATQGNTYHAAAPLVGDVDADGHADLMFFWTGEDSGFTGFGAQLTVLKGQNNDWRPARIVQNQFAYYPASVNDNGTIPQLPLVNSFALPRTNVFGTQAQVLPPVDPRTRAQTSFTYKATDGTLDSQPAKVVIDIAPANRPPKFDSIPPTRYSKAPGAPFTYTAHATDPDVGDTVTYSLLSETYSGGTCTIGTTTGVLSCNVIQTANKVFVLAATDSQGDRSLQTLVMTGVSTSSTVPNVIGQTQTVAGTTLTAAGLTTGVVTQLSNPAPVGQVISQTPSAGISLYTGEAVAITVSMGPAPVFVPFVVGKTESVALSLLSSNGFTTNITRSFSLTIPLGEVMAQSPTAGTLLAPVATSPIALSVSAGSGLRVRLSQGWTTANQSVTVTVTHVDINGVETPFVSPAPVLTVVASDGRNLGALPSVSGNTVTPALDSLGAFTVRATDAATGAQDSAELAVVAASDGVERGIDLAAFAEQARLIASVEGMMRDALAAGKSGDMPTAVAKATQAVQLWRGFDQRLLRLSSPFSPADGLPPMPADVLAHGTTQTAEDLVNLHLLETTVAQFTTMVSLLQDPLTTKAQVDALLGPLVDTAKALGTSNPGLYGISDAQPEYAVILSRLLPDLMDAMMNRLGDTMGLAPTEPSTKHLLSAHGGDHQKLTLIETGLVTVLNTLLDSLNPAKNLVAAGQHQLAIGMAMVKLAAYYQQSLNTQELPGVVAGASLSFHVFRADWSFVEANGSNAKYPILNFVSFVGPDAAKTAVALFDALLSANFTTLASSVKSAYALLTTGIDLPTLSTTLRHNGVQRTNQALRGCIFTSDPTCNQLVYPNGINTVYTYDPASGLRIPQPVIVLVRSPLTGRYSLGTPLFMPANN